MKDIFEQLKLEIQHDLGRWRLDPGEQQSMIAINIRYNTNSTDVEFNHSDYYREVVCLVLVFGHSLLR